MPITGDWAVIERMIQGLHRLSAQACAQDVAEKAQGPLMAEELRFFDARIDPATGATWDANLDGSPGDQVATGSGRSSLRFVARPGARVRLTFADHLRWNLSWRKGQGHGTGHKQNFIPSMSKLPPAMLDILRRVALEVLSEYTGMEFGGTP